MPDPQNTPTCVETSAFRLALADSSRTLHVRKQDVSSREVQLSRIWLRMSISDRRKDLWRSSLNH